jgi:hypothetical protein
MLTDGIQFSMFLSWNSEAVLDVRDSASSGRNLMWINIAGDKIRIIYVHI